VGILTNVLTKRHSLENSSPILYYSIMGYYGKLEEKEIAKSLRKKGYSYGKIKQITGLSKDTISRCCRDIKLTDSQIIQLDLNRQKGQTLASLKGAKTNQLRRINSEKTLLYEGIQQVGHVSNRDRFIAGISLYQAEGSKTNQAVEFTNSDPETINFMVNWFEEFCQIKRKELNCSLWLHDNLSEVRAVDYWTNYLKLSKSQFGKTYFAKNKVNIPKIRKNIHQFGIIKIRYYDAFKLRLILGWIKGVLTA
jgi:hypothetical protein